jgi:hypothetical protein
LAIFRRTAQTIIDLLLLLLLLLHSWCMHLRPLTIMLQLLMPHTAPAVRDSTSSCSSTASIIIICCCGCCCRLGCCSELGCLPVLFYLLLSFAIFLLCCCILQLLACWLSSFATLQAAQQRNVVQQWRAAALQQGLTVSTPGTNSRFVGSVPALPPCKQQSQGLEHISFAILQEHSSGTQQHRTSKHPRK